MSMAASSSAVSDQTATVAKNLITQPDSNSAVHATIQINSAPIIITNHQTNNSELQPLYNCTNCDIKFDSESSLRVHLQVSLCCSRIIYMFVIYILLYMRNISAYFILQLREKKKAKIENFL